MAFRGRWVIGALMLAAATASGGCGDSGATGNTTVSTKPAKTQTTPSPTRASAWTSGYPSSIAVLGHSGSTGENSDPKQPGVEVRENSWVTGTNPKVNSLYLRILEHNPAAKGHNTSYSEAGANIDMVALQADRLLAADPKPDLIVIQVLDNDLTCPLERVALSQFRAKLTSTLTKLARGTPNSGQFVVSQFGSVLTSARSLTREELASLAATGPCDFVTPSVDIAHKKVARLEHAIHAYEGALSDACSKVRQCTYDGGAFGRVVDKRKYVSADLGHFSVAGHAKAAAVAWAAMRRAHVLPRRRPG